MSILAWLLNSVIGEACLDRHHHEMGQTTVYCWRALGHPGMHGVSGSNGFPDPSERITYRWSGGGKP